MAQSTSSGVGNATWIGQLIVELEPEVQALIVTIVNHFRQKQGLPKVPAPPASASPSKKGKS